MEPSSPVFDGAPGRPGRDKDATSRMIGIRGIPPRVASAGLEECVAMLADSCGRRDHADTVRALALLHGRRNEEGDKEQRDGERPQRRSSDDPGHRGEAATVRHHITKHGTNASPE